MSLTCQNICFGYNPKQLIFDQYSKEFKPGITVLKGYSGCGKTTLLKILAGYLKINKGKILTPNNRKVTSTLYRKRDVSYMFQGINLLPLATVERNLRLCAEMAMLPSKEWKRRSEELIYLLGLETFKNKKAGTLSGGQAQRAALARTLMKNSPILLLDEPTSGLDDTNTSIIKNLIATQTSDKICIVSTHDSRLFNIADEIIDFNHFVSL